MLALKVGAMWPRAKEGHSHKKLESQMDLPRLRKVCRPVRTLILAQQQ